MVKQTSPREMNKPPPLSMSQFTTMPRPFEEDLETCSAAGIQAIELCGAKLDRDPGKARDQLKKLRDSGLRVTSFQSRVHSLFPDTLAPEPKSPEERIDKMREGMDRIAEVLDLPDLPCVTIGGAAPEGDYRKARATAHRLLPKICDHALAHGYRVAFEPIHPVLLNQDTFTWNLEEAVDLVDAVGRENLGLVCDVWHIFWEADLEVRLRELAGRFFLVHLSDYPTEGPRTFTDRASLGEGRIDFSPILRGLHEGGYLSSYCLEILSDEALPDSLWRLPPEELLRKNIQAFHHLWKRAAEEVPA